jgi:hypothetical protein
MPKTPRAIEQLPTATVTAIEQLGANLAVARLRRKESLASWSHRMGVSIPTLMRMESGDPGVSMGIYATALWLIGCDAEVAAMGSPERDMRALDLDVSKAVALGKARARASADARLTRLEKQRGDEGD